MEQDILQENVGVQDQIHAAFGGLARYEFIGDSISISPLRLSTARLKALNDSLILVYTGGQRSASEVVASQEVRTKSGANAPYLQAMYEMTIEGARVLEFEGDDVSAVRDFAALLDRSWSLKRQLGSISNQSIDDLYIAGKEMGAWGGKLLGAGGGGFVLFLADPDLHPAFVEKFGNDRVLPVALTNGGSKVFLAE